MQFFIEAELLGQKVQLEGEVNTPQQAVDILRELLGYDRQTRPGPTVAANVVTLAASTEPSGPVSVLGMKVVSDPAVPADVVVLVPSIDDVATAVKGIVAKLGSSQGVPKATALLQEFGAARAKDVAEEKRAAFIAKAAQVTA